MLSESVLEKEPNKTQSSTVTGEMTGKVMKGSFWVLMGQILPLLISFITTPFVIRYLGSESYGVLILMGLISTYLVFADFGMSLASTQLGSEAFAEKSSKKEAVIIKTAAVIAFFSSIVFAIPMFLFSDWIVEKILNVPHNLLKESSIALRITSVSFICTFIGGVFNTPQMSRMRMDLNVLINSGLKILMMAITPVVLYLGGGIVEAILVSLCAAFVIMVINVIVSGRLLPQIYTENPNKEVGKKLIRFGINVMLYNIGLVMINNFEKFVLTSLVSVKHLAYYSVASTFANMTTMFSMAMVPALIPAFTQLFTANKQVELSSLFSRTIKVSLMALLPSLLGLLIISKPFFTIWAGPEFGAESTIPLYILLIGMLFTIIVYVPNCALIAKGKTKIFAKVYLLEIVPYIALTYFLVSSFGIVGAAISMALKEAFNSLLFIYLAKKYTGLTFDYAKVAKPFLIALLLFLPSIFVAICIDNFSPWLLGLLPLGFLGYIFFGWKMLLSEDERKWFLGRFGRVAAIFKK